MVYVFGRRLPDRGQGERSTMKRILAIDAGGSKVDALLHDLDGHVHGWGHTSVPGVGGRNGRAISRAMSAAVRDPIDGMVCIATITGLVPLTPLHELRAVEFRLLPCAEQDSTLAQVGLEHGVVLLAGTGAFVHARLTGHPVTHYDGAGPIYGDFGGGFQIGMLGLQALLRSQWHPRHATSLRQRLLDHLHIAHPMNVIELQIFSQDRSTVAALARIVNAEADAGDAIAQRILTTAADQLAETFSDMVSTLGVADEVFDVVGTGSIIRRCTRYRQHLWQRLREIAPRCRPQYIDNRPVLGIAIYALRHFLGPAAPPAIACLIDEATRHFQRLEQESQS